MKLGIDTAFNRANEAGGVDGRMLKLLAADDGYEPSRTPEAMRQLYERDQVFGIIGNVGTPTAAVAVPYSLERKMLFFGAFTGANILRNDPPDRYVFNYRASYVQETDAVVRYLVKIRRLQPRQIAVFAQQDSYGDAGFAGVSKAFRAMGTNDGAILRLNYARNTIDVDAAVNRVEAAEDAGQGDRHGRDLPGRGKIHREDARPLSRMIYTNVSCVGSTALAEELKLLGRALHQRGHRDPGGAGGVRLFVSACSTTRTRWPSISPAKRPITFRWRVCRGQRPDRGAQDAPGRSSTPNS